MEEFDKFIIGNDGAKFYRFRHSKGLAIAVSKKNIYTVYDIKYRSDHFSSYKIIKTYYDRDQNFAIEMLRLKYKESCIVKRFMD